MLAPTLDDILCRCRGQVKIGVPDHSALCIVGEFGGLDLSADAQDSLRGNGMRTALKDEGRKVVSFSDTR